MRTIVSAAPLPAEALAALKQWLAISTVQDDAALTALLLTALDMCEAFTGQRPLAATLTERVVADGVWQTLQSRPVTAITAAVRADSSDPLPSGQYEMDIDIDAVGRVRVQAGDGRHVAVTLMAGIASDWSALPAPLSHGIIRLAASLFRDRDDGAAAQAAAPPAAVAALWRPFRRMRLV